MRVQWRYLHAVVTVGDVTIIKRVALVAPPLPPPRRKAKRSNPNHIDNVNAAASASASSAGHWIAWLASRVPLFNWLLEFLSSLWGPLLAQLLRVRGGNGF